MITVLRTNDIHGHIRASRGWAGKPVFGFDRIAMAVIRVRAETPNVRESASSTL